MPWIVFIAVQPTGRPLHSEGVWPLARNSAQRHPAHLHNQVRRGRELTHAPPHRIWTGHPVQCRKTACRGKGCVQCRRVTVARALTESGAAGQFPLTPSEQATTPTNRNAHALWEVPGSGTVQRTLMITFAGRERATARRSKGKRAALGFPCRLKGRVSPLVHGQANAGASHLPSL